LNYLRKTLKDALKEKNYDKFEGSFVTQALSCPRSADTDQWNYSECKIKHVYECGQKLISAADRKIHLTLC